MAKQTEAAQELAEVAAELRRHVRWAQARGETHAPLADPRASVLPVAPIGDLPDLVSIRADLGDCRRCKLCEDRKQLVFGAGNPRAELVFVGAAPDDDEDEKGQPLAGKAGQLLTKMIEAMGYRRDEVYVSQVVKCKPSGARNPAPEEVAACEPFLQAQLAALQPKAIVALGQFAAQTLLRSATPITGLRGSWHEYRGIPVMPTYHPAYLLRSPAGKAGAWDDLKQVLALLGKASRR